MPRSSFVLRRMGSAWLLVGCLMATVLVTSALVSALVSFYASALPATVSAELARTGTMSVLISGEPDESLAAQAAGISGRLKTAFGGVPEQFYQATWSQELALPGARRAGNVQAVQAAALTGLPDYAALASGSWPGPPKAGQPVGIALPAQSAADLQLTVGSVLTTHNLSTNAPVTMRVTGTFRPRDLAASYWRLDLLGTSGSSQNGGFDTYGPAVVNPAAFGPGPAAGPALGAGQVSYVALARVAAIRPGTLTSLAHRISAATSAVSSSGSLAVNTTMPQTLVNTAAGLGAADSLVIISGLQLLLLSGAALALASRLLASHRDEESALLSSRGAARWQLVRPSLSEAVIAVVAAAVAGVLAGGKLASALLSSLTGSPHPLPVLTRSSILAGCLLVVFCLGIVLRPALRPAGIAAVRVRRGRQAAVATSAAAGADLALIALALLSVRELRSYSAVSHAAGGGGVDPVVALAPVLALAGLAIIPLRLLPVAARGLDRLTARGRHLGSAMASWEISRRPLRQSGPALLVILAVGTSTLALAQYQSWRQSVGDQAAYAVGAPVRVSLEAPESLGQTGRIARLAGVTSAVPASQVVVSGGGQLLILGTTQAAQTVTMRPDLSLGVPERRLFSLISGPVRSGIGLPGKPERLEIAASMSGGLGPVSATMIVQDAYGLAYPVTTGSMPADGHLHELVARLGGSASRPAYPLRLIGLTLSYDVPGYSRAARLRTKHAAGVVELGSLQESATATGSFGSAVASGADLGGWTSNFTDPGVQEAEHQAMGVFGALAPEVSSTADVGTSERIRFGPGSGPEPPPHVAFGPLAATLNFGVTPPDAVPVIVANAYAKANGLTKSIFQVNIGGTEISCIVRATVTSFPTGAAMVASQTAVQDALASIGDGGVLSAQTWLLSTATGAVPAGLPAGAAATDAAAYARALQRNPLSAAPVQAALAVAAAAALLAAIGFCVSVAASARARRSQRALLAALGVPAPAQARLFCLEELMVSIPAAAVGLAVGIGLAYVLIPSITLTATAGLPVPAVLVRFPVAWVAVIALLAPAIPVLAAAITALRQPDPAAELRAAEAAG
jgi:hypothetical protein